MCGTRTAMAIHQPSLSEGQHRSVVTPPKWPEGPALPRNPPGAGAWEPARRVVRATAFFAALAALLFLTRFVLRADLLPQADETCHIGGVAVEVDAHGVRFPAVVYGQNEHDNGSLPSGMLGALAFALFGRSVLVLSLVTHAFWSAGALAALYLLLRCLDELGLRARAARWPALAALLIALLFAPRVVTMVTLGTI